MLWYFQFIITGILITNVQVSTCHHFLKLAKRRFYAIGDAAQCEGKVDLIATGFGEAPTAINQAIKYIYPDRDNRVVHSTSLIKD